MSRRPFLLHLPVLLVVLSSAATAALARPAPKIPESASQALAAAAEPRTLMAEPRAAAGVANGEEPQLPAAVRADFARGETLLRNGDYGAAEQLYAPYATHADAAVASEALLRRGQAALLDGRYQDALDILTPLRQRFADSSQAHESGLLIGSARRGLGDCAAAVDDFVTLADEVPLLAAQAHHLAAACYRTLDRPADVLAEEQKVLAANPARLLRLEALERQAESLLIQGNEDAALDIYGNLLQQSQTRWYTAELLYQVGLLHEKAGRTDRAIQRLLSVVTDYPDSKRAPAALDELNAMGASDQVTWYQAGLVRLDQAHWADAASAFDQSLSAEPQGPEASPATYYRAVARTHLGDTDAALADFTAVADGWPGGSLAPQALWKAGLEAESDGRFDTAADLYGRLIDRYPGQALVPGARFRRGFCRYAAGDPTRAISNWDDVLAGASADLRAQALLWRGKARADLGDAGAAHSDWQAALDAAPDSFAAARARDLLAGNTAGVAWPAAPLPQQDPNDLDAWLKGRGQDPGAMSAGLTGDPRFQRADLLLRLGQRQAADWELADLQSSLAGQPDKLAALAQLLQERGAYDLSTKAALAALAALPNSALMAAPPALQRLAYPLPYPELLDAERQAHGLDPLLLAALMRQESSYDPLATSGSDARGLTQVIPSTGAILAKQLGRDDFSAADLYRPVVSVEFGGAFLNELLGRFDHKVYPAVAGYNAGPGASARWLAAFGTDDLDVWAERIPYQQTNDYVQKVFANYGRYRLIYGLTG